MKKKLTIAIGIALLAHNSAYALNKTYRKQLERSGCTQVTEAQGCDITKTKEENAKAGFGAGASQGRTASDAKVPGTAYHATGKVSCSVGPDPKGSAQCDFGVIRGEPGQAEVHVSLPGGDERVLNFAGEQVTSPDPKLRIKASKSGDTWSVNINDFEFYEIFEAVIEGG